MNIYISSSIARFFSNNKRTIFSVIACLTLGLSSTSFSAAAAATPAAAESQGWGSYFYDKATGFIDSTKLASMDQETRKLIQETIKALSEMTDKLIAGTGKVTVGTPYLRRLIVVLENFKVIDDTLSAYNTYHEDRNSFRLVAHVAAEEKKEREEQPKNHRRAAPIAASTDMSSLAAAAGSDKLDAAATPPSKPLATPSLTDSKRDAEQKAQDELATAITKFRDLNIEAPGTVFHKAFLDALKMIIDEVSSIQKDLYDKVPELRTNHQHINFSPLIKKLAEINGKGIGGDLTDDKQANTNYRTFIKKLVKEIKVIDILCASLIQSFHKSGYGGLYGNILQVVQDLGSTLDKVISNTTNDLTIQLKKQLLEVMGFAALVEIHEEITKLLTSETVNIPSMVEVFTRWEDRIDEIIASIKPKDVSDQSQLCRHLIQLAADLDIAQRDRTFTPQTLRERLEQLRFSIDTINKSHGGLLMAFKGALDSSLSNVIKMFDDISAKRIKEFGDTMDVTMGKLDRTMDVTMKELDTSMDKTLYRTMRKSALYIGSVALAVTAGVFIMKNHDKPQAQKAGLYAIGAATVYPIIDGIRSMWNWLKNRKHKKAQTPTPAAAHAPAGARV